MPLDTWLMVEVGNRSLPFDRTLKAVLCAAAGLPEYWIADVDGGAIEVYRDSVPRGWGERVRYVEGRLNPRPAPEAEIDVDELFP
jgi:Uma2 family endonuclease